MRNRLHKVEELLGYPLHQWRTELQVALPVSSVCYLPRPGHRALNTRRRRPHCPASRCRTPKTHAVSSSSRSCATAAW